MTRLINNDIMTEKKLYWGRTIASFFLVLFTMPLGHALMRVMEETMETSVMNTCAFIMGAVGLAIAVWGVFVKGDTKQTLFGLFGGLLFWTGWVEFLYGYFAMRFGVHYDLVGSGTVQTITEYVNGIGVSHDMLINGVNVNDIPADVLKEMRGSRPEYLIMPASFGFWVMFIVLYLFGSRTGCHALNWLQKVFFGKKMQEIVPRSMSRHTAITTFMELNIMMWTMYLLLMFVYDPAFLGESHPVTIAIAIGCLVGSIFMFRYELGLHGWGPNIRMAISTVVIFWTTVEVFARNGGGIPALDSPVTAVMPEDGFSGDEVAVPLVERMGIVHAEGVLCQAQAVGGNGFADGGICPVEADLAVGVVVGVVLDAVGGGQHPVGLVVEGLLVVEGGFEGIVLQNVAVFSIQFLDGLTGDVGDAGVLVDVYFFFVEGVIPRQGKQIAFVEVVTGAEADILAVVARPFGLCGFRAATNAVQVVEGKALAVQFVVILVFRDVFYLVDEFFDFGGNCQVWTDVFVVCVHEEAAHDAVGEAAAGHDVDDCRLVGITSGRGHDQFDGFHFVGLEELGDVLVGF